jgi:hypothetical protein
MQPYIAYTQNSGKLYAIALEFPDNQLELTIPKPIDNAKIFLLGTEQELPWRYEDNKLIINTNQLKISQIKSKSAWTFVINNLEQSVETDGNNINH